MRPAWLLAAGCLLSAVSGQWLETTIAVGRGPGCIAYNLTENKVYTANYDGDSVTVINGATNTVITAIAVGDCPDGVLYNPTNNKVYCPNKGSGTISLIDGAGDTTIKTISLGSGPSAMAYNSTNNKVYCANGTYPFTDSTLAVIDGAGDTIIAVVRVGRQACNLVYNSISNKVYSANCDNNNVTVIDGVTNGVLRTIAVGSQPVALGYNSTDNKVYCGNRASRSIMVINGARDSVIRTIAVAGEPYRFIYNPTRNKVYCVDGQNVTVIDGAGDTVIATVGAGSGERGLGYDPLNDKVYCANGSGNNVAVISGATNSVITTIGVGSSPFNFAWNPIQGRVYVTKPVNNTVSVIRDSIRTGDVGCTRVIVPTGNIAYGDTLTPQAKVRNYSSVTQSFSVRMDIGTAYRRTKIVSNLAAGDSVTVSFSDWIVASGGTHAVKCSTQLSSDTVRSNDKATAACFVPLTDAGTRVLLAPADTIPWGTPVTPRARVKNFGTAVIPSFTAKFTIGTFYRDSVTITNLAAGDSAAVNFRQWAADTAGTFTTRCSTRLSGDQEPTNNRLTDSVCCWLTDAAALCIYVPAGGGVVDSGLPVMPRCTVVNRGTQVATFDADMRIGSGYVSTATATGVPPGTKRVMGFSPSCTLRTRGWVPMSCSTKLSGDQIPMNDRKRDSVLVRVQDIGAVRITSPVGAVLPGPVTPRADVHNWGNTREPCKVFFRINSSPAYVDSVVVIAGLPYADTNLSFKNWTAVAGSYVARCSTALPGLPGDRRRVNDTCSARFVVGTIDAGVTAILAPIGTAESTVLQTPQAKVKNLGTTSATGVQAIFSIDSASGNRVYLDTVTSDITAGAELTLTFAVWPKPYRVGPYLTKCKVVASGDGNPANDSLTGSFAVASAPPDWKEKTPLPAGAKTIKDGGWLAYDASKARVYGSRGVKQTDFFAYNPITDAWAPLAPWRPGTEGKLPSKGSAGCATGAGVVYATKGNNTQGFWQYTDATNTWSQKADVPLGATNKKVKGGTDIVWAYRSGVGYAYLLKGYKNEFWRYDPAADSWHALANAPGAIPKWDKGSWLAYDGAHTIYAHKAKFHEFYRYDVEAEAWDPTALLGMPAAGSAGSKKSKDGGCGTYLSSYVYALKGGNTQEFWQYAPATNVWAEKETIPSVGSAGKKKKVKAGADIVAAGTNLYATKGNKSDELWMYVPGGYAGSTPYASRSTQETEVAVDAPGVTHLLVQTPSVTSKQVLVSYSVPKAGHIRLTLHEVTGRRVAVLRDGWCGQGRHAEDLSVQGLARGVYIVRLESDAGRLTRKVIIE